MDVLLNENSGPCLTAVTQFQKVKTISKTPALKEQVLNSINVKRAIDNDTLELVEYIRSPEPAIVRQARDLTGTSVDTHLTTPLYESVTASGPIASPFVPPSGRTIDSNALNGEPSAVVPVHIVNVDIPGHYRDIPALLPDTAPLDLTCLGNKHEPGYDVGPLKAVQDGSDLRENDLLKMEWKLLQILSCERDENKQFPAFAKEMELREKSAQSRWYHYPLYYVFGVDSTGFFQLKDEFDWYVNHPWSSFDQVESEFWDLEPEEDDDDSRDAADLSYSVCGSDDAELTLPISGISERSLDRYLP